MRDRAPGAARLLSGPVTMASVLAGLAPAFSPDSSDGGYEGAREALVQGVIAAAGSSAAARAARARPATALRPASGCLTAAWVA